ncbi:hypothetical protein U1Q18_042077 [Sarracenia purpurea var. burkii]
MGKTSNSSSPAISPATIPKNLLGTIVELSPKNTKVGQGEKAASNGGEETPDSQHAMGGIPKITEEQRQPLPEITEDPMDFQITNQNQIFKIATNLPDMGHNQREGKELTTDIPNNALWNEKVSKNPNLLKQKEINPEKGQISLTSDIILGELKLHDSIQIPDSAGLTQQPLFFRDEITRFEGSLNQGKPLLQSIKIPPTSKPVPQFSNPFPTSKEMNPEWEEITYQKIRARRSQTAARTELDLEDTALPKSVNQFPINSRKGRNPSNQGFWKESNLGKKEKLHQDPNPHFGKSKLTKTLPEPFKDSIEVGKEDSPFTFSNSSQFSLFLFSESGEPLLFLTVPGTNVGLELENPLPGLERCGSGQTENEGLKPSLRKQKKWAR